MEQEEFGVKNGFILGCKQDDLCNIIFHLYTYDGSGFHTFLL